MIRPSRSSCFTRADRLTPISHAARFSSRHISPLSLVVPLSQKHREGPPTLEKSTGRAGKNLSWLEDPSPVGRNWRSDPRMLNVHHLRGAASGCQWTDCPQELETTAPFIAPSNGGWGRGVLLPKIGLLEEVRRVRILVPDWEVGSRGRSHGLGGPDWAQSAINVTEAGWFQAFSGWPTRRPAPIVVKRCRQGVVDRPSPRPDETPGFWTKTILQADCRPDSAHIRRTRLDTQLESIAVRSWSGLSRRRELGNGRIALLGSGANFPCGGLAILR